LLPNLFINITDLNSTVTMDFYHYDPRDYYDSEYDASSSAGPGPKIEFEFGTANSTAQAQAVASEGPPEDSFFNAQAKFLVGMAIVVLTIAVSSEAIRLCYRAYALSHPSLCPF
jgi:hypothetical protein